MTDPWKSAWFASAAVADRDIWRGVEAQHLIATMRLVDSVQEQETLERVLEGSKPPLPPGSDRQHYLVFTPFRYRSPWPSRFRRANEPGAFYGADEPETVAAELGYWRWRFLMDSEALRTRELDTVHTFFVVRLRGIELDITRPPWSARRAQWRDAADTSACQKLGAEARERKLAAIRYESARREGHMCNVVFDPACLSLRKPPRQQTWVCKTTATNVIWAHERELIEFAQGEGGA